MKVFAEPPLTVDGDEGAKMEGLRGIKHRPDVGRFKRLLPNRVEL